MGQADVNVCVKIESAARLTLGGAAPVKLKKIRNKPRSANAMQSGRTVNNTPIASLFMCGAVNA